MSHLRPELRSGSDLPCPDTSTSLYLIREAVRRRPELIYGKTRDDFGGVCAIGAFFAQYPKLSLAAALIDEVAAVNDSVPRLASRKTRQRAVLKFLNFKLKLWGSPPREHVSRTKKLNDE